MRYRVLQPLQLPPGVVLGLDETQLLPRRAWLRELDGGLVEATAVLQFKAGEVLEIDGATAAAYPQALEPLQPAVSGDSGTAALAPPAPAAASLRPAIRRIRRSKTADGAG